MVDHPQDQKDWKNVQNFKLIDKKYYMKNHVLGKGNFAETYLATRVEDENQILACKMIAKQQIMEKLKKAPDPEGRKKYIIDALKNEVQLRLHYIGTTISMILFIFLMLQTRYQYLPLVVVTGYAFAWVGHFFFEKNKPATFKYSLMSFMGDFKMWYQITTKQIKW
ncbi:hypothetical protein ABPG72_012214 [Tetrahymena utriculariae]